LNLKYDEAFSKFAFNSTSAPRKRKDFYVPFTIPVWGVVEPDHVHIDNHLNYVLHVDKVGDLAA
jgi:hypothetical protein